jgi:photosystem II stability/assembly factor-like uncharacterized protein
MGGAKTWVKGLLLALAPTFALGGVNSWTSIGPEGADVRKIVRHPTSADVLYLSALSGFYRSEDAGASWQLVKEDYLPFPTDIAVDAAHPDRVFVAGNTQPSSLLVSEDAGATLMPVPNFPSSAYVYEIAISPDGQTTYTIGGERGTRSTDGGATWELCAPLPVNTSYPRVISIDPSVPSTVYATHVERMFVSTNSCSTWSELPLPPEVLNIYEIKVSPSNSARLWMGSNGGLLVSSNGGANWTLINHTATTVEFDPTDPSVLFTTAGTQLLRSEDEGQTWAAFNVPSPTWIGTIALGHSEILVGGSGVAASTAGDTTWETRNTGLIGLPIASFSAVPQSDRIYMSAWNAPIYYTAGSGQSSQALPQHPNLSGDPVLLAQPGSGADRLLAAYGTVQLGVSVDGGSTWQPIGTKPAGLQTLQSWSSDEQIILGGTSGVLYRSQNGGANWEPVDGLPANTMSFVLASASESQGIAYLAPMESILGGTIGHGVYKTVDFGVNWIAANTGIETVSVRSLAADPITGELVYGTTDDGLIRSTNGGQSWSSLTWPELNSDDVPLVVTVDPVRPRTVYVASRYTVARSIDEGTSWEILRQRGAPEWWPLSIIADPVRSGRILLATTSFGVQRFDVQPDLSLQTNGPSQVAIGGNALLKFTAVNLGPHHATTPRVVMQLPATALNIAVSSPTATCSVAGVVATCTYDVLRAGFAHTITLNFTPGESEQSVSAVIASDQSDSDGSNNSASIEFQATEIADLATSITAPTTAASAQSFSYSVSVTNVGPSLARDVEVTVQLASGLTLGTITSSRGTCSNSTAGIKCVLDTLPAGQSATIAIAASAATAGEFATTVSVSAQSLDEVAANNSASASTVVSAAPTPTPPAGGSGGGGGGGSSSLGLLLALSLLRLAFRREIVNVELRHRLKK